ncbi:hypothetical protein D3C83_226730 [compost metagenome]
MSPNRVTAGISSSVVRLGARSDLPMLNDIGAPNCTAHRFEPGFRTRSASYSPMGV